MSGHTLGPWVYRPNDYDDWGTVRSVNPDEDGFHRHICKVNYVASPEALCEHRKNGTDPAEADARLIAAAPDLLEALMQIAELPNYRCVAADMRKIARAAIARAEGGA